MKPTAPHVVRDEAGRLVFTNQAGQTVTLPRETTVGQLLALGITVRLHKPKEPVEPETFVHGGETL